MPPLTVMIKPVSGACNMRCAYCFYTDVMARRDTAIYPRMTLETLEAVVRSAFRCADGAVSFAFQGGEPTLAGVSFFEALVRFEKTYNTRGIRVTNALQTNGFALSDALIALLARERFLVGVSLDGTAALHDRLRVDRQGAPTCDRVLENIRRLQAAGVEFNILCVVNDWVAREPARVFQALAPYGFIQFIPCLDALDGSRLPWSLTPERYLDFLRTAFDLYCAAFEAGRPVSVRNFDNYIGMLLGLPPENCAMGGTCGRYFLVEGDGGVYPCDFYVLDEWRVGNINETPFSRLGKSPRMEAFVAASLPVPEKCRSCRWFRLCRNGCKRERDPETGLNRWCECTRAFLEYSYPRMLKMAERVGRRP